MSVLTNHESGQLREVLRIEQLRLVQSAKDGLAYSMNRDRNIGRDSGDEAMEEELFSTELRLRDREKGLLYKINCAIDRLTAGTINACEDCSEPIGFRRLVARPVTTLCISCKEDHEREEAASASASGLRGDDAIGSSSESQSSLPDE